MDPAVSTAANICNSSVTEMPKELAMHLYENGAFMVFLDVDEQTEFGIDYKSWHTGTKFKGMKMIPPGVHFIYFSVKTAPRIGFFHCFKEREVLVRKWDSQREDMSNDSFSKDQIEAVRANLKNMDGNLAPYPYETYRNWFALSNYITENTVARLRPENHHSRITGQAELVTMESDLMANESNQQHPSSQVDRDHPTRIRFVDEHGLPIMRIKEGFQIRFSDIPILLTSNNPIGSDYSDIVTETITNVSGSWNEFLGELQFAFICFLLGQVYEGFEQWKRLIHALCNAKKAIEIYGELYHSLLPILHFQLKECPQDFFVDIVTRENFLTASLSQLFVNINESAATNVALKKKSKKFKNFLEKKFKWNFDAS